MANGIRTGDPCGFNKGRSSKFREGSRVRQTPEEGRRIYRPKRCGNNNKDEDNSPKTPNDKKHNWCLFKALYYVKLIKADIISMNFSMIWHEKLFAMTYMTYID